MVSPVEASQTIVVEEQAEESSRERQIRLVGSSDGAQSRPSVTWTEDTVDNENLGRKKSKICCIFHSSKKFDESSEESASEREPSSSSDSDSDSGSDSGSGSHRAISRKTHTCRRHRGRLNAYERLPGTRK